MGMFRLFAAGNHSHLCLCHPSKLAANHPVAIYVIISAIFMISAGGFTIAWEAENAFKAIWVGASFPALVSALIRSAPALPS